MVTSSEKDRVSQSESLWLNNWYTLYKHNVEVVIAMKAAVNAGWLCGRQSSRVHGRPQDFLQGGANPEASLMLKGEWHICVVSTCGTPTPAAVFLSVEKRLTLCRTSVTQKINGTVK